MDSRRVWKSGRGFFGHFFLFSYPGGVFVLFLGEQGTIGPQRTCVYFYFSDKEKTLVLFGF